MKRLSSVDAQFLAMEDGRVHSHVCQLTIIEGRTGNGSTIDGRRIRDLLAQRIDLMPPFRWRIKAVPFGIDYPVVVEDEAFDLDSHIWESALPVPGTDQQLGEAVGDIASRPLDRARSLWELHVINGLADGRVALVTKVHHAIVDGVSGTELLGVLLDPTPETVSDIDRPKAAQPGVGSAPSDIGLLVRAVGSLPMQPVRMVRHLPMVLRHVDQLPTMRHLPGAGLIARAADRAERIASRNKDGRNLEHRNAAAPKVSFGGRISAQRRFAFGSLPLSGIKAVKDAVPGATVNDVVVALCAGGLRRRMLARGDDVSAPLVSLVPVSVRTGQRQQFGNQISSMIVPIPTDERDPRRRLARAHAVMRAAKERHRAIPAKLLTAANHSVPPALLTRTARMISMTTGAGWIRPPFNVTISNIPGSRRALFCADARVVSQHPVNVLLDGVGLSITLLSYEDRIDFGLTADRELLPDVWCLADELADELRTLATEFEALV
ncbi:wax ester/triacylglycerol synthase family O-acyltransferase [Mycolicibacterium sp.]|uniref:WS/DGAT/MGAT family O-acyltransferase n=1 Tax=Mycolicibacterium sp. TaxID=2320850 RepID=UPI001D92D401|nr:wax ester/triacylglycerol synthase family O-acyltransferase [Mycolicibacterium sp.]MCB1290831.1 wax ester/triacylglycerol synthase family O-acyltransferase [Mycobacterium sp.]MCB9409386.1 wax ester/triacylglycerol synthase family O-acyltransferase [Mycolicibacterium sp.]